MRSRTPRLAMSAALALLAISLTFIVPAGMFAATVTTATTSATTTCDEGRWPARVQGQPATFAAGARAGDYIWHDANGWHLRFTHPGDGPGRLQRHDRVECAADREGLPPGVG